MRNPKRAGARISRRDLLKRALAGAGAALAGCAAPSAKSGTQSRRPGIVQRENQLPGTREWLLEKTRIEPRAKYRCPWIEGYASATSVRPGQTIEFFVSTNPPAAFVLEIFRMGYYGGDGGRLMRRLGPFSGVIQPEPEIGKSRVRECRWDACASIDVPQDWLSGVYLGKLTEQREGLQSYIIFIVRDDRQADFLFQCSDTTWQAYNRWPSQFSLYDDGQNEWYWGPGVDISFDRPYGKYCQILDAPLSTGSGEWFLWEYPLAYWLESAGADVTYISNLDLHEQPGGLGRVKGFLSVGHDEYYSIQMFDHLRHAIRQGLSVAFLSGNTCCGRIDPRPSSAGIPNRLFGRVDAFGPADPADIQRLPTMAHLPHRSPCSSLLVGARNLAPFTGGADWVCSEPHHWIFKGTAMKGGEGIPGLVGWEWHGDPAQIPGLVVVATAETQNKPGELNGGRFTATCYPGPKGNFVFNASTCWWADGLAAPPGYLRPSVYTTPQGPDFRVQQITRNVLERMKRSA